MTDDLRICRACTRRSWLLGVLAPHLEVVRGQRGAVREVLALDDVALARALAPRHASSIIQAAAAIDVAELHGAWARAGTSAVCRHDPDFPRRLLDLPDPPSALHLKGPVRRCAELLADEVHTAGVVGSRRASAAGAESASDLARGLSAAGVTVVSGMAMGIDAAAHRGALACGSRTVAVLASGPEVASPAREAGLHRELVEHALVVSELPPGTRPWRWAFPARNRIIAALGGMTVIVEAAERSGSLITAEIASDLGRDVGAVPGSPLSWRSAGTNALLRDGARVVRGATDVVEDLIGLADGHDMTKGAPPPPPMPVGLAPSLAGLLDAIDSGSDTVAALAAGTRPVGLVLAGLSELELLGHVRRDLTGRYVRVRA